MRIGQTSPRRGRGGFSLVEMLAVMVILAIISFALAGVFSTVITDIPRSYRVIQTNTTLLNMLEQMRDDIITAKGLPESFGQYAASDGLLLIEMGDGVISYMVMDDKVLRCNLTGLRQPSGHGVPAEPGGLRPDETAADDGKAKDTGVWSVPHAKVEWQVWRESGKGYAVQVETHIEHKIRGHWERKMANSHLYFVGACNDVLR